MQLRLGKIDSRDLFLQIARDAQFLYKQGIMDYSLLLGVHYCTERREAQHCSFLDTLCEEKAKEIGLQVVSAALLVFLFALRQACVFSCFSSV